METAHCLDLHITFSSFLDNSSKKSMPISMSFHSNQIGNYNQNIANPQSYNTWILK